jgi:hypothetical protein
MKRLPKEIKDLHTLIAVAFNNMTEEQQKQTIEDFEDEVELSENEFITDFLENIIENFSEFQPQYECFPNAGIKVHKKEFLVCSIDHDERITLTSNEAVRLKDIPSWDLDEIIDMLKDDELENFKSIMLKAGLK